MPKASIRLRTILGPGPRIVVLAGFAVLGAMVDLRAQEADPANSCAAPGLEEVIVAGVADRLELDLADGRRVLIAGVEAPAQAEARGKAGLLLSGWLAGKPVRLTSLLDAPDRWGRVVAHVHSDTGGGVFLSVAHALVDAGWARVRPHVEASPCLSWLLAGEESARNRREGLWSDSTFAVLQAGNSASLANRTGEWVVVEGRVHSVNETQTRTYINFGPSRNVDLTVTIPRQTMRNFTAAGVVLKQFWGKTVSVRGLLEHRPGPQIEIALPQAISVPGESRSRSKAAARRP